MDRLLELEFGLIDFIKETKVILDARYATHVNKVEKYLKHK